MIWEYVMWKFLDIRNSLSWQNLKRCWFWQFPQKRCSQNVAKTIDITSGGVQYFLQLQAVCAQVYCKLLLQMSFLKGFADMSRIFKNDFDLFLTTMFQKTSTCLLYLDHYFLLLEEISENFSGQLQIFSPNIYAFYRFSVITLIEISIQLNYVWPFIRHKMCITTVFQNLLWSICCCVLVKLPVDFELILTYCFFVLLYTYCDCLECQSICSYSYWFEFISMPNHLNTMKQF